MTRRLDSDPKTHGLPVERHREYLVKALRAVGAAGGLEREYLTNAPFHAAIHTLADVLSERDRLLSIVEKAANPALTQSHVRCAPDFEAWWAEENLFRFTDPTPKGELVRDLAKIAADAAWDHQRREVDRLLGVEKAARSFCDAYSIWWDSDDSDTGDWSDELVQAFGALNGALIGQTNNATPEKEATPDEQ